MIRSRAHDGGLQAQVTLSPREVARAVEETGLPADVLREAFVLLYPDVDLRDPRGYGPPMDAQ